MQKPDTLKYCTPKEGALLKAGIKPHSCEWSIDKAKELHLPNWEQAGVYLHQFIDAINAGELNTVERSRKKKNGLWYRHLYILVQDVIDWPSLDDRYDMFGFDRSEEDINPKSKRAYNYLIQGFMAYMDMVESNKSRPEGFRNRNMYYQGKLSHKAVKELLMELHPKTPPTANTTLANALNEE